MFRKAIQWLSLLGSNAWLPGFWQGRIYSGKLKSVCVPGLNCYSCPGAVGSCPLGALQAVLGSWKYNFSYYVIGLVGLLGLLFGRFICGFLCPFGLIQELINKIPLGKASRLRADPQKTWRWPLGTRYVLLAVFVVALPLLATNAAGIASPAFCKYICPVGTLTAGLPLMAANPPFREAAGRLFLLKLGISVGVVLACLFIHRFFCRYLCPLGALYGFFNGVSLYRLRLNRSNCVNCGACSKACPMAVDPSRTPHSPDCILCGKCVKSCHFSALDAGFFDRSEKSKTQKSPNNGPLLEASDGKTLTKTIGRNSL
ncbi:MAG: 4Fe-4S binding protein [Synergistaceae bacterium]|jgi:polyferredoxin|nr:4Fe-4S binding protein [Synergistaceae bacterium]